MLCCLLLYLFTSVSYAQKASSLETATQHYQKQKRSVYLAANIPVKASNVNALKSIVNDYFEDKRGVGVSLVLMRQKESLAAHHFHFQQMYRGFPVYNAFVDLVVSKKGVLKSISHSLEDNFPEVETLPSDLETLANNYCTEKGLQLEGTPTQMIFHSRSDAAQLGVVCNVTNDKGLVWVVVLDPNGNVLFKDMLSQMHHPDDIQPSAGRVFIPDPLTSAGVAFGGGFGDNNDANSPELDGELKNVELETCIDAVSGLYTLDNDVVSIVDFNNGQTDLGLAVPPPTSSTGSFLFNRSEPDFEAVSAFYHITAFQRELDFLGFEGLVCTVPLKADARALNDDNSFYNPSQHSIRFGLGGIDDAEDSDVCVHEYGHGLSFCANGNATNSMSTERDAIEEGLCDYFAASYSKDISAFGSDRVFNWDGNAGAWAGRTVRSLKQYPDDLNDNQYSDAPIWSSVLMEIWDELGQETTDQLMMQALYAFTPTTTMPMAAQFVLDADDMLNECENFDVLMRYFHKRGILGFEADAGEDQAICLGESAVLGGKLSNLVNSFIEWTPSLGLSDPTALFPEASPPVSTTYTLTITDNLFNQVYTDEVAVEITPCLTDPYGTEIEVLNSGDLALFGQGAILRFPETAVVKGIYVYSSDGRFITELEQNEDNLPLGIDFSMRAPGVYLLEIRTEDESKVFKLLSAHWF